MLQNLIVFFSTALAVVTADQNLVSNSINCYQCSSPNDTDCYSSDQKVLAPYLKPCASPTQCQTVIFTSPSPEFATTQVPFRRRCYVDGATPSMPSMLPSEGFATNTQVVNGVAQTGPGITGDGVFIHACIRDKCNFLIPKIGNATIYPEASQGILQYQLAQCQKNGASVMASIPVFHLVVLAVVAISSLK